MLFIQRIEIHRGPGTRAGGRLDDRRDEIPAFTLEARQQLLGLLQILEPVLGVVGITRSDQATKLQLHQQGLERQLADVALVRQWPQQKLPLTLGRRGLHLVEHAACTPTPSPDTRAAIASHDSFFIISIPPFMVKKASTAY